MNDPSKPKSAVGLKSSLAIFRARKLPKKSVTWKSEEELEAVQFFEVDATERSKFGFLNYFLKRNSEREVDLAIFSSWM